MYKRKFEQPDAVRTMTENINLSAKHNLYDRKKPLTVNAKGDPGWKVTRDIVLRECCGEGRGKLAKHSFCRTPELTGS